MALETRAGSSLLLRGSVIAGGITLEGAAGATVVSWAVVTDFATPAVAADAVVFICDKMECCPCSCPCSCPCCCVSCCCVCGPCHSQ